MKLDFFNPNCRYPPILAKRFGLCDSQDGSKAYPDINNEANWIATVINNGCRIVFTAIDKCVLFDHEYPSRGRCDGMLTTEKHLYLVELKDQKPPWQTDAEKQLLSTINFLKQNHNLGVFKIKKAFACNKKRAAFVEIDNEKNNNLFRSTGFRLDIQAEIIII